MDPILLFFVFPLVTIIFSIALEKVLDSPFLVASIIFAIFLIVAFTAFSADFVIYAIAYAAIALVTAYLYRIINNIIDRLNNLDGNNGNNNEDNNNGNNNNGNNNFPNTNACRVCCCQRQFCRCLRGRQ